VSNSYPSRLVTTTLPTTWLGKDKPDENEVADKLHDRFKEITGEVDPIVKLSDSARQSQAAVGKIEELNTLLGNARKVAQNATSEGWTAIQNRLQQFETELRLWRTMLIGLAGYDVHANARTRFADAGFWAMHFSVVRMTVTTFLITAAWGIVSLKWKEYSPVLSYAAAAVWLLALLFLWFFTRQIVTFSEKQKAFQAEIPTKTKTSTEANMRGPTRFSIWLPFVIFLFMTIGFWTLLHKWATKNAVDRLPWYSIEAKESARHDEGAAIDKMAKSVDGVSAKLDKLIDSADQPTAPGSSTATPIQSVPTARTAAPLAPRFRRLPLHLHLHIRPHGCWPVAYCRIGHRNAGKGAAGISKPAT
jgi:hypothetical protein